MEYWFGPHIDVNNIISNPDQSESTNWRYAIEIPFKNRSVNGPIAIVILKNPSQAGKVVNGKVKSDKTVNKVCVYFYVRDFSKVIILNLAALYATDLSSIQHQSIFDIVAPNYDWRLNDRIIRGYLKDYRPDVDVLAVGWGAKNDIRGSKRNYDRRISMLKRRLERYASKIYKYPSNTSYPIHPATNNAWFEWEDLVPY